jgi:thioredoxin
MALPVVDEAQLQGMLGKGRSVVVDFYADWCGPCRAIAPELEKLASESEGSVDFVKLDVDANPRLTAELGIMGIPTVIHFAPDGSEFARAVGAARGEELARRLRL